MVPGQREQVCDAAAEAVPDAVFRDTGHARAVVHGDFLAAFAAAVDEHGQEPVDAVEAEQTVQRLAAEDAQRAAGVREIHAERGLARGAGDAGGDFAEEIIKLTGTNQKVIYNPLPKDDPKQRQPDIKKAREILGWEPKVSRAEGLKITYEYFKSLPTEVLFQRDHKNFDGYIK